MDIFARKKRREVLSWGCTSVRAGDLRWPSPLHHMSGSDRKYREAPSGCEHGQGRNRHMMRVNGPQRFLFGTDGVILRRTIAKAWVFNVAHFLQFDRCSGDPAADRIPHPMVTKPKAETPAVMRPETGSDARVGPLSRTPPRRPRDESKQGSRVHSVIHGCEPPGKAPARAGSRESAPSHAS